MVLKQLNKILILLALGIGLNICSQMKMSDLNNKEFSINLKSEKRNLINIFDDNNYSIYYIIDKKDFNLKKELGINGIAKVIFFSKKYNKGILTIFRQSIYHKKKSLYDITLHTGSHDKYMFFSSMALLDKNFNYQYFMKYYYMAPPPPEKGIYKSWVTIQDVKNYCSIKHIDLQGNLIYEDIDAILSNITKFTKIASENCDSIIYDIDRKDFFSKKISK